MTPEQLEENGFHFYRESFRWGYTPAYRTDDCKHYRFVVAYADEGTDKVTRQVMTPAELLEYLLKCWRPVARDDWDYAASTMRVELEALPE